VFMKNFDGHPQITYSHWQLNVDNGKPPPTAPGAALESAKQADLIGGDSIYPFATNTDYARVLVKRADFPWDPVTGAYIPKRGVWQLPVNFQHDNGFAYVDPQLHAMPPSHGTVVYDGPATPEAVRTVPIDTTKLTDGMHKVLLGTCNTHVEGGKHCGTLVIRFLVKNDMVRPKLTKLSALRNGRVAFDLSEPASVVLTLERPRHGHWMPAGTFTAAGAKGHNAFKIPAAKLRQGRYRVGLVATDPSGNASRLRRVHFSR
jgi:hypothetical protein